MQRLAIASDVIKLAAPLSFDDFLELVEQHADQLAAIDLQAALESGSFLNASGDRYASYVAQIIRNNPNKSVYDILGRSDVQGLADQLTATSLDRTIATLRGAHSLGTTVGVNHLRSEAKALGLSLPPKPVPPLTSNYLSAVETDMQSAVNLLGPSLRQATTSTFTDVATQDENATNLPKDLANRRAARARQEMERAGRRLSNRARAAGSVVASRAYTEAQLTHMQEIQEANPGVAIRKVWVTSFGANTCGTCAALHGTVLDLDVEYDHGQSFTTKPPAVYQDLNGPPRHPSCNCRVSIYLESFGDAAAAMREEARKFAVTAPNQAPRSWSSGQVSDLAQTSAFASANDFAVLPDTQFESAMQTFRTCFVGKSG